MPEEFKIEVEVWSLFRAVFGDARLWRKIIDALSTLIDEANFVATSEGLRMRAMDPSRVAMVDFEMDRSAFNEYLCDQETMLGVNFDDFKKILKRATASDKLELEYSEEEKRLKVRFIGRTTRTFSIPLLEFGQEELATPRITFNASVKMLSESLKEAIKDAEVISDFVRFEANPEVFIIRASGDRGEVEVKIDMAGGGLLSIDVKEPSFAYYSLSYLGEMIKASQAADVVGVEFSTNMPLKLDFELPSGRITYYLAPRMEAE